MGDLCKIMLSLLCKFAKRPSAVVAMLDAGLLAALLPLLQEQQPAPHRWHQFLLGDALDVFIQVSETSRQHLEGVAQAGAKGDAAMTTVTAIIDSLVDTLAKKSSSLLTRSQVEYE